MSIKKCPACGAPGLVHDVRTLTYTYKGKTAQLEGVEGEFCDTCGDAVLQKEAGDRYGLFMRDFQREVNGEMVDSFSIQRVRKKLHLGQREAGEIFGGGVNAFSRYETGQAKPPVSLVKLLGLLDRHPELLEEVRAQQVASLGR